jgi:hypothetical protein
MGNDESMSADSFQGGVADLESALMEGEMSEIDELMQPRQQGQGMGQQMGRGMGPGMGQQMGRGMGGQNEQDQMLMMMMQMMGGGGT